jgi:hypothetical protein
MKKTQRHDAGAKYVISACACLFVAGVFIGLSASKQSSKKQTTALSESVSKLQVDLADTKQSVIGADREVVLLKESVSRLTAFPVLQKPGVPSVIAPALVIEASKVGLPQGGRSSATSSDREKSASKAPLKSNTEKAVVDIATEQAVDPAAKQETRLTLFDPTSGSLRLSTVGR